MMTNLDQIGIFSSQDSFDYISKHCSFLTEYPINRSQHVLHEVGLSIQRNYEIQVCLNVGLIFEQLLLLFFVDWVEFDEVLDCVGLEGCFFACVEVIEAEYGSECDISEFFFSGVVGEWVMDVFFVKDFGLHAMIW